MCSISVVGMQTMVLLNHFTLEATYFWLLIEGLYLHNAIFYSVFFETKVWLYPVGVRYFIIRIWFPFRLNL